MKQKLLTLALIVTSLAAGFWVVSASPLAVFRLPNQTETTTPSVPPSEASLPPEVDSGSTIVTFESEASKTAFIAANNVAPDEIEPSSNPLRLVIQRPSDSLKATGGVGLFQNVRYTALLTPNDTYASQTYTDTIDAYEAWDSTTGSSSVTIAVIDTGFALSHEDMSGRWFTNSGETGTGKDTNGIDDDSNGLTDDWRGWDFYHRTLSAPLGDNNPVAGQSDASGEAVGHGSVTSGLAGAAGNNAKGGMGLDWTAKVLPLQALGDDGTGFTSDVIDAVEYAVDMGADVINMSFGSSSSDPLLEDAINDAIAAGVVVVAASGNDGCECIDYPARYSSVIAVGASNTSDGRASFSSYGSELDLVAPGSGTIRTPIWTSGNQTTAYTSSVSGTSVSAPIVAGAIGLHKALASNASLGTIVSDLRLSAAKVSGMGGQTSTKEYGYGRLNAYGLVRRAATAHPDGTLVRDPNNNNVYLIQGGQKRLITSIQVFQSYYTDVLNQSKVATAADLALTSGSDLNFKSGTVVKGSGPSLYLLAYSGSTLQKRHIPSPAIRDSLGYGNTAEWLTVSDGALSSISDGSDVNASERHVDQTLVRQDGQNEVYLIDSGTRRYVAAIEVLQSIGKGKFSVRPANSADMALSVGADVGLEEGSVVKGSADAIYVIDDDSGTLKKRHIVSIFIHQLLEFKESERLLVNDTLLPSGVGTSIQ